MLDKNTIFTIGRQFGSGGRGIGKALATRLGLGYYDAELLSEAADISGLLEDTIRQFDEKAPAGKWQSYVFTPFHTCCDSLDRKIFQSQADAIKRIAEKGGCVLVGRCADYILRDRPNAYSVFIHAAPLARLSRIRTRHPEEADKAEQMMRRIDKSRSWYYSFYTGKTWGAAESYDLSVRSDLLGVDGTVDLIAAFAKQAK